MAELIPLVVVLILAAFGVFMIAREGPMTQEEYNARKEKGNALGSALREMQEILIPNSAEHLRATKDELREEADPSGDPPGRRRK